VVVVPGGSVSEVGYGVAVDSSENVYVAGWTTSTDFPTAGGFDTSLGGSGDAFVTKMNPAGSSLAWSSYLGGSDDDVCLNVTVDSSGNVFVTGYTFSTDFPTAGGFDTDFGGGLEDAFVTRVDATGNPAWSSYLGGSGNDIAGDVAVDPSGDVYVAGDTQSPDFPTLGGFDTTFLGGPNDAFVTKLNAFGPSIAWSSYLAGSGDDGAQAVAVDLSGNLYVTGWTNSTDFPTTGGFDTSYGGGTYDGWVAKVNAAGWALTWSSYLGGSAYDSGYGVAVDPAGNAYITGYSISTDFPMANAFDTTHGGSTEAFVTQLSYTGSSLGWSSYLGESSEDYGTGIALIGQGSVCVVGSTSSPDFPSSGGFDTELSGTSDAFVTMILVCGDGTCSGTEDPCVCPLDCGADTCGNGCCGTAEDASSCPMDCPDVCGDAVCSGAENGCNCPGEGCAVACPNGCCEAAAGEDHTNCPTDCPQCNADGACDAGENPCACRMFGSDRLPTCARRRMLHGDGDALHDPCDRRVCG
jgi:hypothetical protein